MAFHGGKLVINANTIGLYVAIVMRLFYELSAYSVHPQLHTVGRTL